jgi:hypothetical protein
VVRRPPAGLERRAVRQPQAATQRVERGAAAERVAGVQLSETLREQHLRGEPLGRRLPLGPLPQPMPCFVPAEVASHPPECASRGTRIRGAECGAGYLRIQQTGRAYALRAMLITAPCKPRDKSPHEAPATTVSASRYSSRIAQGPPTLATALRDERARAGVLRRVREG